MNKMSKEIQMWPSDEENDYPNKEDEESEDNEDSELSEAMKEMFEWQKSNMMPMTYSIH